MRASFLFIAVVLLSIIPAPAWAGQVGIAPKISFEATVCDLGHVGLGTKNTCEFKFTNTGRAPLKITNAKTLSVF